MLHAEQRSTRTRALDGASETAARALVCLAAAVSFVLSVTLWFTGNEQQAIFVGLWVPSILALGGLLVPARRQS